VIDLCRTARQFSPISGLAASISSRFRFASAGAWRHLAGRIGDVILRLVEWSRGVIVWQLQQQQQQPASQSVVCIAVVASSSQKIRF